MNERSTFEKINTPRNNTTIIVPPLYNKEVALKLPFPNNEYLKASTIGVSGFHSIHAENLLLFKNDKG